MLTKSSSSLCRPFSSVVRRPSSLNCLHFHLLLENTWLDFNQTWQESFVGGRGFKVVQIVCVAPMGARRRAQRAKNHAEFQDIFSSRSRRRIVKLCSGVDTLFGEEQKLFMAVLFPRLPQWAPVEVTGWGGGPSVKSYCFIFFLKTQWSDFNQTWQESILRGRGFKVCPYGTCGSYGG